MLQSADPRDGHWYVRAFEWPFICGMLLCWMGNQQCPARHNCHKNHLISRLG